MFESKRRLSRRASAPSNLSPDFHFHGPAELTLKVVTQIDRKAHKLITAIITLALKAANATLAED